MGLMKRTRLDFFPLPVSPNLGGRTGDERGTQGDGQGDVQRRRVSRGFGSWQRPWAQCAGAPPSNIGWARVAVENQGLQCTSHTVTR